MPMTNERVAQPGEWDFIGPLPRVWCRHKMPHFEGCDRLGHTGHHSLYPGFELAWARRSFEYEFECVDPLDAPDKIPGGSMYGYFSPAKPDSEFDTPARMCGQTLVDRPSNFSRR